ncbi:MAG: NADPH-dependent glutamate synthase [Acidimicrobiia bacterium]|nr:NADPH-dependent glutamate synthase [Acidimicrobiia bacterium]
MSRTAMPTRPADERRNDFEEVALGFDAGAVVTEASRCLLCRRPPCVDECPVGVQIVDLIEHVAEGRFAEAAEIVAADNSLPSICGRVCPQERQCEGACVMGRKRDPIAIGAIERFVADYIPPAAPAAETTGHKVAIVGSGPAGLACAGDLARAGHDVTVFEALHELGGVLVYGIPEFRLPKSVVADEIGRLEAQGVAFETDVVIGASDSLDDLLVTHDAVFIGVGAGLPRFLNVPGEHLIGVFSANEFLTRLNLMKAYEPDSETPIIDIGGLPVAVFGGGNTAMDAARSAVRLGAGSVTVFYRRSDEELPARREEIEHAKEEGVVFELLTSPLELRGNDEGKLTSVVLQRMELGEPDESGRRSPVPLEGDTFETDVSLAIVAIGNAPNPLLTNASPDLEVGRRGTLVVDDGGATNKTGVYAGGDIVTGGATVILAMGAGRRAAAAINEYLVGA